MPSTAYLSAVQLDLLHAVQYTICSKGPSLGLKFKISKIVPDSPFLYCTFEIFYCNHIFEISRTLNILKLDLSIHIARFQS